MTDNANDILMGGGAGNPSWWRKEDGPGTRKVARIVSPPQSHQEREYDPVTKKQGAGKVFPSGDPIMGVHVDVATDERDATVEDDDGTRTFWIDGKRLKQAVKAAVLMSGAAGLEVGGTLDVTLTHYDEPGDRRSGRNWQIVYTPAANNVLMGDDPWATAGDPAPQAQAPHYQQPPAGQQTYAAPPPQQPVQQQPAAPAGGMPTMTPEAMASFMAWQAAQQAGGAAPGQPA